MYPTEFVSNGIAYILAGGTETKIYTNQASATADLEIDNIDSFGTFLDGTVVAWAQKLIGATFASLDNGATFVVKDRGTATVIWGGSANLGAQGMGLQTIGAVTLQLGKQVLSFVLDSGTIDNLGVVNSYSVLTPTTSGDFTVTGLAAGVPPVNGMVLFLAYYGTDNVTFANASASSTAANRIYTATGADVVSTGRCNALLIYDSALGSGAGGWNLFVAAL
jgi:hypothetical protein